MERQHQINFWYAIVAIATVILIQYFVFESQHVETIAYSKFEELLKAGAIKDVAVSRDTITATLKGPAKDQKPHFSVVRINPGFADALSRYGVEFTGVAEDTFFRTILSWVLPSIIFVAIWVYVVRRMGEHGGMGALMAIGKSKAKIYMETDTKVTFADVAGGTDDQMHQSRGAAAEDGPALEDTAGAARAHPDGAVARNRDDTTRDCARYGCVAEYGEPRAHGLRPRWHQGTQAQAERWTQAREHEPGRGKGVPGAFCQSGRRRRNVEHS
jgi:hypothetical protein